MPRPAKGEDLLGMFTGDGGLQKSEKKAVAAKEAKEEPENGTYVYELVGDFPIVDGIRKYPPTVTMPYSDIIFDEETGSQRNIRYLTGVNSIFEDEQGNLDEKAVRRLIPQQLQFNSGKMIVDARNTALVQYMNLSNFNQATKNRRPGIKATFRLVDTRATERARLDFMKKSRKAAAMAEDADEKAMLDHASYVGILPYNHEGMRKSPDGIRAEYIKYAAENPEYFMKTYDNPYVSTYVNVRMAVDKDIITLNHVKGQAHWSESKALILTIPEGKNSVEVLAKHALSDDGKSFKERLQAVIDEL